MLGASGRSRRVARAAAVTFVCVTCGSDALHANPALSRPEPQQAGGSPSALLASLSEGFASIEAGRLDDARAFFERAIPAAQLSGDVRAEAEANRGLGRVLAASREYAASQTAFERALVLFEQVQDHESIGRVWNHIGTDALQQGKMADARRAYDRALEAFVRADRPGEQANIMRNMMFLPDRTLEEKLSLIATAVDRARAGGARITEGLALHTWGDLLFGAGNYIAARAKLDEAVAILEPAGRAREMARVYTSLGRLYRAHGDPARALSYYERALASQRVVNDVTGEIQTLNAMALALHILGRPAEAGRRYTEALTLARSTQLPAQVGFILHQIGTFHVDLGNHRRAAALLEEALPLRTSEVDRSRLLSALASAYLALGRQTEAVTAADGAVSAADEYGDVDARRNAHFTRSEVRFAAGSTDAALEDLRETLRMIERLRPNLLPADPLKLGFAERLRYQFDFAVSVMMHAGRVEEAFLVGEQGRARAFLDLLASQDANTDSWDRADPELKSFASAETPAADQLRATAARLGSTVVSYWVTPDSTFAWVMTPDGHVRGRRIKVAAARLEELVRTTWATTTVSAAVPRGADQPPSPRDRLAMGVSPASFRTLYDILIGPVREWLPKGDGALLTVVPHGPLLRLSFAALRNERGRYLLEGYRVHHTPALSVLQFTGRRKASARSERLLVVANPSPPASVRAAERLPPLPGAEREADAIVRVSSAADVRTLTAADARESVIRADARNWTTLHFAAHGIVRDDQPLTSFLALSGSSGEAADDGRLTAREIYGLDLQADLVVLSACRSAGGRITGDGIVGLTRAFMYAGAPSVIASVWDVSDETAPRLFEAFYAARARGEGPGTALREAQLKILRALREGAVAITTPAGRFVLPEHPAIWGGLQLWGEP